MKRRNILFAAPAVLAGCASTHHAADGSRPADGQGDPQAAGAVDHRVELEIDGTRQAVRLCAARPGLPPVLVAQAGPGFPLLNEVSRFQQQLALERDFTVAYWDQRGCGEADAQDAQSVSLKTQVDDLCFVARWLQQQTGQRVVVLGVSLGATYALQAAAREPDTIKAVVAVSIDTDLPASDSAAHAFLHQAAAQPGRNMGPQLAELGAPPYTTPTPFQLRARLLTELGGIERGKTYGQMVRSVLFSLVGTYGPFGTVTVLRNMDRVQHRLLPELAGLNLFADWPRPAVPVHYVFGSDDPLAPAALVEQVSARRSDRDSVTVLADAGHMAHFDQPARVRELIARAAA